MTFTDTNVFVYAVGNPHPLKDVARAFFEASFRNGTLLYTSAEVLQELAHVYLRVGRYDSFDAAISLLTRFNVEVWPLEQEDVALARQLHEQHPNLSARDLCHLASCQRRGATGMMTFDRDLAVAFGDAPAR